MPLITEGNPVTNPNFPNTNLTGALLISKEPNFCNTGQFECTNRLIVEFENGVITKVNQVTSASLNPIIGSTPVDLESGTWFFDVVPGEPSLITCGACYKTPTYTQQVEITGVTTWDQLIASGTAYTGLTSNEVLEAKIVELEATIDELEVELDECRDELELLKEEAENNPDSFDSLLDQFNSNENQEEEPDTSEDTPDVEEDCYLIPGESI